MNVLWICNRLNDRKKLFLAWTSIASEAKPNEKKQQQKKKWQTKIPHRTFAIFILHYFNSSTWQARTKKNRDLFSAASIYRSVLLFALRASICTLSISTNKSINMQEVFACLFCCMVFFSVALFPSLDKKSERYQIQCLGKSNGWDCRIL